MKMYVFEGTSEEISKIAKEMQISSISIQPVQPIVSHDSSDGDGDDVKVYVSESVARTAFTRRPLSDQQKVTLTTLTNAYPNWVTAFDLQEATNYTAAQFAGLMGAFGRRVSHTPGFVEGSWLFDCVWDDAKRCWVYKLPETVYDAIKAEEIA